MSRKPVTGSMKYCTEMRPETGVQPKVIEKRRMAESDGQKDDGPQNPAQPEVGERHQGDGDDQRFQ